MFKKISHSIGAGSRIGLSIGLSFLVANSSYGQSAARNFYAAQIMNMDETAVWNALTGPGVGACRLTNGDLNTTACQYYLITMDATTPWRGLLVYNSDNTTPSFYYGAPTHNDPTVSRMTGQCPATIQQSTGCVLPWGVASSFTLSGNGLNANEQGLPLKTFLKVALSHMAADAADPCKLEKGLQNTETSLEMSMVSNSIAWAPDASGNPIAKKCYISNGVVLPVSFTDSTGVLHAPGEKVWVPLSSQSFCSMAFNIKSFGSAALNLATGSLNTLTVGNGILSATEYQLAGEVASASSQYITAIGSSQNAASLATLATEFPFDATLAAAAKGTLPGATGPIPASQISQLYSYLSNVAPGPSGSNSSNALPAAQVNALLLGMANNSGFASPSTVGPNSLGYTIMDNLCGKTTTSCGAKYNCSVQKVSSAQLTVAMAGLGANTGISPSLVSEVYAGVAANSGALTTSQLSAAMSAVGTASFASGQLKAAITALPASASPAVLGGIMTSVATSVTPTTSVSSISTAVAAAGSATSAGTASTLVRSSFAP